MQLWQPSPDRIKDSNLFRLVAALNQQKINLPLDNQAIYEWSIQDCNLFWSSVWDFTKIIGIKGNSVIKTGKTGASAVWFPESKLNFARNLMWREDHHPALVFWGEDKVRRVLTYAELQRAVCAVQQELRKIGLQPGDRVAAYLPNTPETVICMLATTSLGGVWASCSPDFGVDAVCDRFEQIEPKVFLYTDGYYHKSKWFDCLDKASSITARLISVEHSILVPYDPEKNQDKNVSSYHQILTEAKPDPVDFTELPFDHPLFIMFSSGTTGKPKCIVHRAGGVLLEHKKELVLHTDLKEDDVFFYQTTCSWMMWNWLVSGLSQGCTLVLYDGSPLLEEGKLLLRMAEQEKISIFGTNPRFLANLAQSKISPKEQFSLSALRSVLSTGSPLLAEQYDYVYQHIKSDLALASISGGTDIIGCFALGSPLLPVYRGELQSRSFGYEVDVFNNQGESIKAEKGELVCKNAFPTMPLGFWNDPDGVKFKQAYFSRFPNVWHHGDYVELTERDTLIFYGRSDAVLNPGGVRIGTAEIYRQVETLNEIEESVVVGQRWNDDVRIVLFVRLKDGIKLTSELEDKIRTQVRNNSSPFHVPKKILEIPDIPRTHSGKIVELAVRSAIHGETIENMQSLANPEALEHFKNRLELEQD